MKSEQINELAKAMSVVQGKMGAALKNKKNPFFKSDYADLGAVWEACRQLLSENGLSVIQTTDLKDSGGAILVTTLIHSSGQWIEGWYPVTAIKQDPQGIGSAITYARRYALAAIVGVVADDDDGEHAMGRNKFTQPESATFKAPEVTPTMKAVFEKNEAQQVKDQMQSTSLYHNDPPPAFEFTEGVDPNLIGNTLFMFGKNKGKTFAEVGMEVVSKSIWGAEKALSEGAEWADKVGVSNVELFIKQAKSYLNNG